jgi:Fe-S oxidoreductase
MVALIIRRWLIKPSNLTTRQDILLHPRARLGVRRDSAIVGSFILVHVGSRFLGQAVKLALHGNDIWQPFADRMASLFSGINLTLLTISQHILFWLAIGTILLFIPYFLYSKHLHLFFAPLNFLLKPDRRSIGQLDRLNFEDESVEKFGATHLEDLGWEQIMDAYACIMCYRCQEVCPAYKTGKVLSPAALEINKRYLLNQEGKRLANGEASSKSLVEFAIPPEAIWACTACGACVDICPTNNEPMRDILDIRRALVLMENDFPEQLQSAFRGMERSLNPWNIPPTERMKWAEGLDVATIQGNPHPEILWWVGCAPATDARAQKIARAFAQILKAAEVNFAVLGKQEQCTGDSARRAGNELLFNEMASANVEILNAIAPPRIVTTCPHCLHTLKNEYPAFGGNYQVIHHTQLIDELVASDRLRLKSDRQGKITFHDPCYLGRQNKIISEPRQILQQITHQYVDLPRHGRKSFCCGAGGAQMWKEEEHGDQRVSANRMREAIAAGVDTLAIGCPFCMVMLTDAANSAGTQVELLDIAEIVAQSLEI